MYGSIIGDIIGSPYEANKEERTKDFPLFSEKSHFTDDSVMTIAVAEGLLDAGEYATTTEVSQEVEASMRKWGEKYPDAGYASKFKKWLTSKDPKPYSSFGNGSAMRVSAVGWLYNEIEHVREIAAATAMPTHNHKEGIKGAEAIASAVYLARKGNSKEDIKKYIEENFGYDLNRTCDQIRPNYRKKRDTTSCMGSVPEAIIAFIEGRDFEDVVRTAVSLGGDSDTLGAMAGAIAEAFYGIPAYILTEAKKRIPNDMLKVLDRFAATLGKDGAVDPAWEEIEPEIEHNDLISKAISIYNKQPLDKNNLIAVLEAIRFQKSRGKCFIVPSKYDSMPDSIPENFSVGEILKSESQPSEKITSITDKDGKKWYLLFTDRESLLNWESCSSYSFDMGSMLKFAIEQDTAEGFIINLNSGSFKLYKHLIASILKAESTTVWDVILPTEKNAEIKADLIKAYQKKNDLFDGNDDIVKAMHLLKNNSDEKEMSEKVPQVLFALCEQIIKNKHFIVPVWRDCSDYSKDFNAISPQEIVKHMRTLPLADPDGEEKEAVGAFTDISQFCKGDMAVTWDCPILSLIKFAKEWDNNPLLVINPWDDDGVFVIDSALAKFILDYMDHLEKIIEDTDDENESSEDNPQGPLFHVTLADITTISDVDAIVNSANNSLSKTEEGLNGAIFNRAGPKLELELRLLGGCETGAAKISDAYNLPCKHIIHTVAPKWYGGKYNEREFLIDCYISCLYEALENGVRKVAFPPLATGSLKFPLTKASKIAVETVAGFLSDNDNYKKFDLIEWVCEDIKTLKAFQKALSKIFGE